MLVFVDAIHSHNGGYIYIDLGSSGVEGKSVEAPCMGLCKP